jgi:hypothetical protein
MEIDLTEDEALVLFDLLSDYGTSDDHCLLVVRHAAERNALWAINAALEKYLVAPFQRDYSEQLAAARSRVEAQGGSW